MNQRNKLLIGIGTVLAAAATFFLIKKRKKNSTEKPPKKAPQLNLENPGSQHEFPKAPIESELG